MPNPHFESMTADELSHEIVKLYTKILFTKAAVTALTIIITKRLRKI